MSSESAASAAEHPWRARARYFHSGNAFAQTAASVPSVQFTDERDRAFDDATPTGLVEMDLAGALETPFPATTPLVLSRYARIRAGESLTVRVRASAQIFCVLAGSGTTTAGSESSAWKAGDVLVLPGAAQAVHAAEETAVAWLVTDEPALAYLDLEPPPAAHSMVQPTHYVAEDLAAELDAVYEHPDAASFPGYAVVLSHAGLEASRNVHRTMTLALSSLPAGASQRPHVHSSMALTLCLQGEGCHSTIAGERKDWSRHAVMLTPPGAPHSHHNEGPRRMECLIVQDGQLHQYMRTMGFAFVD